MNVFYGRRDGVIKGVVLVVRGVGGYKSGVIDAVMDVAYDGVVV